MKEWTTGRLDVHPRTAGDLAVLAKAEPGPATDALQAGITSFDRAAAMTRLANTGVDQATMEHAEGIAVDQIGRLAARQRRMTPCNHQEAYEKRRLWIQPNLENTAATGTFTLSGVDVDILISGLDQRADQLCEPGDPHRPRLEQRRLDAFVSLALDVTHPQPTNTESRDPEPAPRRLQTHIFIDATVAARTSGEAGATTRSGIKIGTGTLEEILCIGETRTTLIDTDELKPVPTHSDRLPNRTRDYIFYRDSGCTAAGCTSRYRLEPHHIEHQSRGGDHDPENLCLLCWFHHHVVIHQQGFRIDPASPPGKRRFLAPGVTRAPPNR